MGMVKKPNIDTKIFKRDDLPDHVLEEINILTDEILKVVVPTLKNANSMNNAMASLTWILSLIVKNFVAEAHQQKTALRTAETILKNLEEIEPIRRI
jgi:ribosomal protein L5